MTGHLIHIGFPKTGSNFLRRWFAEHPQLGFKPGGIAGFQDVYDIARQSAATVPPPAYRVTSYEGLTTPSPTAGRRTIRPNDAAPMKRTLERGCAALASAFPNAHILIVTRGFRSMMMSAYSQYVRSGGMLDLEAMVSPDQASEADALWHYDFIVGLYRAAFDGRVIVPPYELLRDDPARFIRAIEEALGLDHQAPSPRVVNASLSPLEMHWYPRLTQLIRNLPVGDRVRTAILRLYVPQIGGRGLGALIALLQRLNPGSPVGPELIRPEVMQLLSGRAQTLRLIPHYEPYADDYLL